MKQLLLMLLLAVALISSTEFEEAYKIYKDGDFEKSFVLFSDLAEDGDNDAAYILGYMYENGEGCEASEILSARWYKISAKGYYAQTKHDTSRDIDKEQRKLYNTINKSDNSETQDTIRQITQSLYSLKAYKPNYFLPASYRHDGQYANTNGHKAEDIETEFQLSIKFDFAANLLGLNEIYSVAYTQIAFWQLYSKSAYFRETNYNPEFSIKIPTSELSDAKFIKAVKIALEHESNGRGGVDERSWNSISGSFYFQYKPIFSELKLWYRLPDNFDYNPDLIDYMGHGHLRFILPYEKHLLELLFRHNFSDAGAIEANYSYPVFGREDLFLYMKAFSGYGESLIDYDNYINKVGIGFSISR
ncbi:phospholipase A1 [Sulfurimonas gotlandica GD1]|uniref:Phosphatidylcholine 1-acylhydrolase n=1 Tax=Sulfurimonas gotlandica (strain DSM 19862 / JCM 16533 / GD1) TaxID=929558 RepID=B6BH08_SULGG|nr:phospholipase A [Sulfurimonas gotlandica]EDZ63591.1 phospholipase A1 [Sulfurimonas gotlandica GD1]EHP29792.1 phospholipase A1 [Sulfurimonas gotlandica GD1]